MHWPVAGGDRRIKTHHIEIISHTLKRKFANITTEQLYVASLHLIKHTHELPNEDRRSPPRVGQEMIAIKDFSKSERADPWSPVELGSLCTAHLLLALVVLVVVFVVLSTVLLAVVVTDIMLDAGLARRSRRTA